MNFLSSGNYLGIKTDTYVHKEIIASKAEYIIIENKDWHCHENAFFAYFLKGGNYEYRKTKEIRCSAGTLLFYRSGEPHCNKAYIDGSRIFHVEIDKNWLTEFGVAADKIKADVITDPSAKKIFINILDEFLIRDEFSGSSIEHLLMYTSNVLTRQAHNDNSVARWNNKFNSIIKDSKIDTLTLQHISRQLNIHPVTFSKKFSKYYRCSFGDYIRNVRIEKSIPFLSKKNLPINNVAYQSGFSDASNFIRAFKKVKGVTPNAYRKLI